MKIDIVSDTVCPWCFIGKRRIEKALSGPDAPKPEIAWHPFQLNPDMPAGGMDRSTYLAMKFGGPARALRTYAMIADAAASEDLHLRFDAIRRTPNTVDSHRLIDYAAERGAQDAVVEALFRAYFESGADIGDRTALAEIAEACGLDGAAARAWLDGDSGAEQVRDRDRRFRAMGIQGVPFFIVDGRYAVSGAQDAEVFRQVFAAADRNDPAPAAELAAS